MNNFPAQQCGVTLVIALTILVVVTLPAVSSMREVMLENRITSNVIEQTRLQNTAEPGPRKDERRFVNTPRSSEPGTDCTVDSMIRPYLLDLVTPKLKLMDTYQNLVGVLRGIASTWMSYRDNDIIGATTTDTLYSVQWNNLLIPSGGQVNGAGSPGYGNLICGIGTFYYGTDSVARNQANSETVLQTVPTRLYTNWSSLA